MEEDLLRCAADLAERCERTATVTSTAFLTPAEQYALTNWARHRDCTLVLHGGGAGCERRAAFFLPFYLAAEDFDPAEHLCAVHFSAPFGAPGHRDYLGAILGLGIRREWVGDILVQEHGAYVFCLPSVAPALLELEQVGRTGVKAAAVELAAVPVPERKVRPVTFTVQSARLDAVVSGMFRLSRTSAAAGRRRERDVPPFAHERRGADPRGRGAPELYRVPAAGCAGRARRRAVAARRGQGQRYGSGRHIAQGAAVRHGGALAVNLFFRQTKCPHRERRSGQYRKKSPESDSGDFLLMLWFTQRSCRSWRERRPAQRPERLRERQRRQPDRQRLSANAYKRRRRHTR